jgi:hypothetical protein
MEIQVYPTENGRWSIKGSEGDPADINQDVEAITPPVEPFELRNEAITEARKHWREGDTIVLLRPDGSVYGELNPQGAEEMSESG